MHEVQPDKALTFWCRRTMHSHYPNTRRNPDAQGKTWALWAAGLLLPREQLERT